MSRGDWDLVPWPASPSEPDSRCVTAGTDVGGLPMDSHGPVNEDECEVVALCASAGGVEALTQVLESLPNDFPAAVIVLQHQQPERTNALAGLLQHRCTLPVRLARDRDLLVAGQVLVVPPGTHMLIGWDAQVRLVRSGSIPPFRPSADLLLCTAAAALGPRLIAVILSGGGHDGAVGAEAVHAFGGRVLAQDPRTAFAPGMPSAAIELDAPQSVELEDIAGLLTTMVSMPVEPENAATG